MNETAKKDNRGYLYPNKNKNKPTQPDYTGKVLIDGKELRISAWENQTPEGNKYLSLAFSPALPATEGGKQDSKTEQSSEKSNLTAPVADDLDLDAILNSTDDDNPF
jgi:uncharacterized protein (DUF736 family)